MLLRLLLLHCFLLGAEEEYFVVFLVNARGLDYTSGSRFLKTVAKHPRDGSKNGDVGHAWIYLKGEIIIEGGHSGELGDYQPCYMEGVLDNCALGASNPVSYLWCGQADGFFQKGNGGHVPSFAAKVLLNAKQYASILDLIKTYPFHDYSLTGYQCCTFVREIAKLLGLLLEDSMTLEIEPTLTIQGRKIQMWQDPKYRYLTFSSPDRLEESLKQLVKEGKAENALNWYQKTHKKCWKCQLKGKWDQLKNFPTRWIRYFSIRLD